MTEWELSEARKLACLGFRIRHVGAPLRREDFQSRVEGGHGAPVLHQYEFLFEVQPAAGSIQPPWCIQKDYRAFIALHDELASTFQGLALPSVPDGLSRSVSNLFRSKETLLKSHAQDLEAFLNTLLVAPRIQKSQVLMSFLEVPPAPREISAEDLGAAMAEAVTTAPSRCCRMFRSFCGGIARVFQRRASTNGSVQNTTNHGDGANSEFSFGSSTCSFVSEEGNRMRQELLDRNQHSQHTFSSNRTRVTQHMSAQSGRPVEVNVPMGAKLQEWS